MQTELAEPWEAEDLALDDEVSSIIPASSVLSRRSRDDARLPSREAPTTFGQPSPFPTTRYYGSKRRQMDWLREEFGRLEGCTALDAFGGTGAVSHLLSQLGWDVTYNDVFQFNTISARALFSSATVQLSAAGVASILRAVRPRPGFIAANFAGLYFTDEENAWLDGFMATLAHVEPARIITFFPDLEPGTAECPRGCTHDEEECALDAYVASGAAGPAGASRLDSLRRLLRARLGTDD